MAGASDTGAPLSQTVSALALSRSHDSASRLDSVDEGESTERVQLNETAALSFGARRRTLRTRAPAVHGQLP